MIHKKILEIFKKNKITLIYGVKNTNMVKQDKLYAEYSEIKTNTELYIKYVNFEITFYKEKNHTNQDFIILIEKIFKEIIKIREINNISLNSYKAMIFGTIEEGIDG